MKEIIIATTIAEYEEAIHKHSNAETLEISSTQTVAHYQYKTVDIYLIQ